jgi:hypothetical protein
MMMVQTKLASVSDGGLMVCWLPRDPRVKVGTVLSLAKSDERWRVEEQWSTADVEDIRRGWKVGGLA